MKSFVFSIQVGSHGLNQHHSSRAHTSYPPPTAMEGCSNTSPPHGYKGGVPSGQTMRKIGVVLCDLCLLCHSYGIRCFWSLYSAIHDVYTMYPKATVKFELVLRSGVFHCLIVLARFQWLVYTYPSYWQVQWYPVIFDLCNAVSYYGLCTGGCLQKGLVAFILNVFLICGMHLVTHLLL